MTKSNLDTPVGQWVATHPQTSRVFEELQLDYCCGGGKSLEQACKDRGLDPRRILRQLEQTIKVDEQSTENWLDRPLTELCDHIEQTHHAYLKRELPRLTELIDKVVNAHGDEHRELHSVRQVFAELRGELEPHMFKEEQVLFPAIRRLDQTEVAPTFPFGTVANPIRMMEHEHADAGDALSRIRQLTDTYSVPEGACNTYHAMLDGLRELEANLHQHVHKENNILFPRAIELEGAQIGAQRR